MKWKALAVVLLVSAAWADSFHQPARTLIEEEDGSPSVPPWKAKFPNTSLTDNGDGTVSVAFSSSALQGGSTQYASRVDVAASTVSLQGQINLIGPATGQLRADLGAIPTTYTRISDWSLTAQATGFLQIQQTATSLSTGTKSDLLQVQTSTNSLQSQITETARSTGTFALLSGATFNGLVRSSGTAGTSSAFATVVTLSPVNSWEVRADGLMSWGDGTNARDTNLYRSAANTLKTDDGFESGTQRVVSQVVPASGAGTEIIYAGGTGYITAYDRSGSTYRPFNADGSTLGLNTFSNGAITTGTGEFTLAGSLKVPSNATAPVVSSSTAAGWFNLVLGTQTYKVPFFH